MFGPIRQVVFDFDGTLVDTMSRVTEGLGAAIEHVTRKKIPESELVASFGPSPQAVLAKWVSPERVDEALNFWLDFEKNSPPDSMKPFPEVETLLSFLKNQKIKTALFTGRDRESTLKILKANSWYQKYYDENNIVCGDDGHAPKPSAEGLIKILNAHNWNAKETLMVGDHPHDMISGASANCKTGAALWDMSAMEGKTKRARFKNAWDRWNEVSCDLRLQSPLSLVTWLKMPQ